MISPNLSLAFPWFRRGDKANEASGLVYHDRPGTNLAVVEAAALR